MLIFDNGHSLFTYLLGRGLSSLLVARRLNCEECSYNMVEPNACKGTADSQKTTQTDYGTRPEMLNAGFSRREDNWRTRRKTLVAQNQRTTLLKYVRAGNRTQDQSSQRRAHHAQATRVNDFYFLTTFNIHFLFSISTNTFKLLNNREWSSKILTFFYCL